MKKLTVKRNNKIHKAYTKLVDSGKTQDEAVETLAKANHIGIFYVRNILKKFDVEFKRKQNDKSGEFVKRDSEIIEMFFDNTDPADIGNKFDLTPTRVWQILRDNLGKYAKNVKLEKILDRVKKDIAEDKTHKELIEMYGASVLRKLKANLGFNTFDSFKHRRDMRILELYKEGVPVEKKRSNACLTAMFDKTPDHIYSILRSNGIKFKLTKEEKKKRDQEIMTAFRNDVPSQEIADAHGVTVTLINIIIKANGGRKKHKKEKVS